MEPVERPGDGRSHDEPLRCPDCKQIVSVEHPDDGSYDQPSPEDYLVHWMEFRVRVQVCVAHEGDIDHVTLVRDHRTMVREAITRDLAEHPYVRDVLVDGR